jgi:transcription antitermination factor NusG
MGRQWRQSIIPSTLEAGSLELSMREWFAVQVWAGREALTTTHLQQRGYEVFLPAYEERRHWSDRVKILRRALFAGYVFCRSGAQLLDKVITTPGVIRIVGDGRSPLPIPAAEIEAIRRITSTWCQARPWPFLREGEVVRIEAGPIKGVEGIVVRNQSAHRLVVAITLLQRSVAVEIDADWVAGAGPIDLGAGWLRR